MLLTSSPRELLDFLNFPLESIPKNIPPVLVQNELKFSVRLQDLFEFVFSALPVRRFVGGQQARQRVMVQH